MNNNIPLPIELTEKKMAWKELVEEQVELGKFKGATCKAYSQKDNENDNNEACMCGRLPRDHSFDGNAREKFQTAKRWVENMATVTKVTAYGQLKNEARFIRCDTENDTFDVLAQIIRKDVGSAPKLIVSCYGGAAYFIMTDDLEREFMNGIGQLASTKDVWILTTGLNSGVSKVIGQGVHRSTLLDEKKWKPVVIGMNRWGTIDLQTREQLKKPNKSVFLDENESETLDHHHTHFLLLDNGNLVENLNDDPRSKFIETAKKQMHCYAVTIIVEGGKNTVEVIQHDLRERRPVVIVHGSGRLADVLGNLLEDAGQLGTIEETDIERQLKLCPTLCPSKEKEKKELIEGIQGILKNDNRRYLSLFRLDPDANLMNTIFRAVFDSQIDVVDRKKLQSLLELAIEWNCLEGAHDLLKRVEIQSSNVSDDITKDIIRNQYSGLFEKALKDNRPQFVDYFLRRYYNPLETTKFIEYREKSSNNLNNEKDICKIYALEFIINKLYKNNHEAPAEQTYLRPSTLVDLDKMYFEVIGPYAESLYYKEKSIFNYIFQHYLCKPNLCSKQIYPVSDQTERASGTLNAVVIHNNRAPDQQEKSDYHCSKDFDKQEMLRDIFLWSVYEGYIDTAFVLLLQLKTRISAALIAAGMAHHLSLMSPNLHGRNMYDKHREALEKYASQCIDACYSQNERKASELLLREIPLFANITCMQVAIATRSIPFINTICFNQVLNRLWYDHLDGSRLGTVWGTCKFTIHIATFGFFAPIYLDYRSVDKIQKQDNQNKNISNEKEKDDNAIEAKKEEKGDDNKSLDEICNRGIVGIHVQYYTESGYWRKWKQFHGSPAVMTAYQFALYIWFLLVFSYFMLFEMTSSDNPIHWTEIYVIITISAMLFEDIRRLIVEFNTRMIERWHRRDLWVLIIYVIPYALFYIGMGLHFGSKVRPDLFAAARIVLALDLEIWYLFSLRFVSAIKVLGPKLFMIRNMMRDLFSILYIIFVCIAAYGVVSRSLTMYESLEFTARDVFTAVFYQPYWLLYSDVDGERQDLDEIISSNTSTTDQIAEATATHVLLAFHMLFINILLLSLLVAMFNFSINDVQALNKYFWHYQRYELIREHLEKPLFAYPPLSLLIYFWMVVNFVQRGRTRYRAFKHLCTPESDRNWTDFENAATYMYARGLVEEKYRPRKKMESESSKTTHTDDNQVLQTQTEMHKTIKELQSQTKQMMKAMDWMMTAVERVKMSAKDQPRPTLSPLTDKNTVQLENQQ